MTSIQLFQFPGGINPQLQDKVTLLILIMLVYQGDNRVFRGHMRITFRDNSRHSSISYVSRRGLYDSGRVLVCAILFEHSLYPAGSCNILI